MRKAPGKGPPFPAPFCVRRTGRMRIREPVYPHGGPDTDDGRKMTDCRKSLTNSLTSYIMDPSEVIGMVFRLLIDRNCVEEVTATVHERTALINEIERLVLQDSITDRIPGYEDDTIVMIPVSGIECFYVEKDKTYAHCADKRRYLIKKRLYELDGLLPDHFERINKSAIANWTQVAALKAELSGAVNIVFKSGYVECISRRCFSELRRRYGL